MMISVSQKWQWFPSEAVSWQSVSLPKGRGWREALPFAVEEKLADTIECLRIVPTPSAQNGLRWVAVINESVWQRWHAEQLESNAAVCPDVLALPWSSETGGITVVVEDNRVRLRWGQWQGAAGDIVEMTAVLSLLQNQVPQSISVYAHHKPEAWQQWQLNWHPLTAFVPQTPSFDLREGVGRAWFKLSKLAAYRLPLSLSALLLTVLVASASLSAWQAQQQAVLIKQQTEAQFVAAFPDIKRRVNPLVQAKSELRRRQTASKEQAGSLMSAVTVAQQALAQLPPISQLSWQQGKLTLTWSEVMNDNQRRAASVSSSWQLRWLSDTQCEVFQGAVQ